VTVPGYSEFTDGENLKRNGSQTLYAHMNKRNKKKEEWVWKEGCRGNQVLFSDIKYGRCTNSQEYVSILPNSAVPGK
jgi:hypothetical protein